MEFGPIARAIIRNKVRFGLIVLQIAITLAVVTNAINMILAERAKMLRPSGFDDDNLMWVQSKPFANAFGERAYRITSAVADERELRTIPGVLAVSNTYFIPWQGGGSSGSVKVAGGDGTPHQVQMYSATPGIIDTLGVRLIEGRDLRDTDIDDDPNSKAATVLISHAMEQLLFGNQSAVGRQLIDGGGTVNNIVGVFDPFYNPYGFPIHEYAVFAAGHSSYGGATFLVRTQPGAMKSVAQQIPKKLVAINDGRNVDVQSIDDIKHQYFTESRIIVGGMTAVIVLLLLVTGLGIVGVTSFAVTERTRQIGTRRALGATRPAIVRYFLVENWMITSFGSILGLALAYALNFLLVTSTQAVKLDWRIVAIGIALLWVQTIAATLAPAIRAASVPPVIATRAV
ncbi:MAG TPA: FtsX-like permease family protein [Thermoanaerobaculia bacterium]|nr:FtsX-like permease family protein [Thermoanaerobaculia bacterium]